MKYIINPAYVLRHEGNKAIIISRQGFDYPAKLNVIHPLYAMMLTFFNGQELYEIYDNIGKYFNIDKNKISKHLTPLLDNKNTVYNGKSVFPPHVIVSCQDNIDYSRKVLSPESFAYDPDKIDLNLSRLNGPIEIICNLTLRCVTSCIYCYADREGNKSKQMSFNLAKKILLEAQEIGVVRFKLMGGEVLLHPHWEEIIQLSIELGYQPDISIKKPLSEDEIIKWKSLGATIDPIQISLDTLIVENLVRILNVRPDYIEKIKQTFILLDRHQVPYVVHTVINRLNDTVEDVRSLNEFFKDRTYLKGWMIDAAKCSMYNGKPYNEYRSRIEGIIKIREFIEEINSKKTYNFKVKPPTIIKDFNNISKIDRERIFRKRNLCSGNMSGLYILPDGKVTICEELYWHPKFLLGDLNEQTLKEIWNSKKANDLFFLKQTDIPSDSPCSKCEEFSDCRRYKHICWRDTILAYGRDKWYYPDIACPKAPFIPNNISME